MISKNSFFDDLMPYRDMESDIMILTEKNRRFNTGFKIWLALSLMIMPATIILTYLHMQVEQSIFFMVLVNISLIFGCIQLISILIYQIYAYYKRIRPYRKRVKLAYNMITSNKGLFYDLINQINSKYHIQSNDSDMKINAIETRSVELCFTLAKQSFELKENLILKVLHILEDIEEIESKSIKS